MKIYTQSANAGHCTSCGNKIYPSEFLKFDFELKGDLGNKELKIIDINRIRL